MSDSGTAGTGRRGAEAVLQALRTGEASVARFAGRHLADDVCFVTGFQPDVVGRDQVVARLSGQWPITAGLARGNWQIAQEQPDLVVAHADFPHAGAAPEEIRLSFRLDDAGRIAAIEQGMTRKPAVALSAMSPVIRRRIDRALADGNAITVGYVDGEGRPVLSLRGSLRTYNDRELSMWARNAKGGLVDAVKAGRPVSMLYRDPPTRTTMIIEAVGRIAGDEETRDWIYSMMPEVEATHDVARQGAAIIFTVRSIKGMAPEGNIDLKAG